MPFRGIRSGIIGVVEEYGFAHHVQAMQVMVEFEKNWKVPRGSFEVVWTDSGAPCL